MRVEIVLLIAAMAAVTYLTRVSLLVTAGRFSPPEAVARGLKFIPVGILTAFIVPGLLVTEEGVNLSLANPYLVAGIVSALVAARWRNVFFAMGSGMAVVLMMRLL